MPHSEIEKDFEAKEVGGSCDCNEIGDNLSVGPSEVGSGQESALKTEEKKSKMNEIKMKA